MSNITSNKYRKGTATLVDFPTVPSLTRQPRRIDLIQNQYAHDILLLEFPAESTLWFETLKTGIPVSFNWRQDTLDKNWIGYVSSITRANSPQRTNVMQVMCVGGTFPLKQRVTRVFENTTVPDAVSKIGTEYGFTVLTDPHPQIFPQLAITGNSYWEWIQEQAKRVGYGVIIDGMTMVFRPIDKLINMTFSNAPVLSLGNAGAPFNTQYLDRTLDEFKIIYGDNVESSNNFRTIKNVGGVDPLTQQIVQSNSSPADNSEHLRESNSDVLFSEFRTDRVVNSPEAAKATADAAAQQSRFGIPATIKGQGDPRLRPFGTVYVSGTGDLTDGYWMINAAHHMFHQVGDYTVELSVSTDGIGDAVVETPFRTRTSSAIGTLNLEEATIYGDAANLDFPRSAVKLMEYNQYQTESNQGYLRTPSRWQSVGKQ